MELRPGFQQTEVGAIPVEWEVLRLRDLSVKVTDGDHATPRRESSGYYLLSARNVHDGRIDLSDVDYVGRAEFQRMRLRCDPEAGDILISCSGSIGRVAVVPERLDCVLVRSAALVKVNRDSAHPLFLQFWLQGSTAQRQIASSVNQGAQPNLFLGHIEGLRVPRVLLAEQRAIAEALSDVDGLLGGLDRLIAKKRDLKQAAMQQLLTGQTRLPGFTGEWEVKRLGDICDIAMGRTPPRLNQAFWGRGHVWLSIADIQSKVVTQSKEEITELAASSMTVIPRGTLLMSFKLSIGRLCFAGRDLFTNEAICSFNKLQASADFLYYAVGRTDFSLYGKQAVKGYTLNRESLALIEVCLPSAHEQTTIAAILSDLDAELTALEARRDKTVALKQAMMQELLTGRTRLV